MKINLTKLLETPCRVKQLNEIPQTAIFIERKHEATGSKESYSFEIDKIGVGYERLK